MLSPSHHVHSDAWKCSASSLTSFLNTCTVALKGTEIHLVTFLYNICGSHFVLGPLSGCRRLRQCQPTVSLFQYLMLFPSCNNDYIDLAVCYRLKLTAMKTYQKYILFLDGNDWSICFQNLQTIRYEGFNFDSQPFVFSLRVNCGNNYWVMISMHSCWGWPAALPVSCSTGFFVLTN